MVKREKTKVDRKAIDKIGEIQDKYGGYRPDLILMLYADRLNKLTRVLIAFSVVLAILTGVHIWLLLC